MQTKVVECPSGFSCEIREMLVSEEDMLASSRNSASSQIIDKLLDSICLKVVDWGIYPPQNEGNPKWHHLLLGDRFYLLYELRILSFGSDYEIAFNCSNCGKRNKDVAIPLEQLNVKKLSEEAKDIIMNNGGAFDAVLPRCNKKVRFKLMRGSDETVLQSIMSRYKNQLSRAVLDYRVIDIDDVSPAEKMHFIKNMSSYDARWLRNKFDEVDCGIDQETTVECEHCSCEMDLGVQFDANFFFPNMKKNNL